MAYKLVELSSEDLQLIVDATTDKAPHGGLLILWTIILGKPLSEFTNGEVQASNYRLAKADYEFIFSRSYEKLSTLNGEVMRNLWVDKGPAVAN